MIQIDMPMPKNCLDCPACNEYLTCAIPVNGRKWGENDVREFGQGRPEWCPLKEQEAEIERLKRPDCEHANHDGAGCLGYCGCEQDDEPINACKQCEKYTGNICAEY